MRLILLLVGGFVIYLLLKNYFRSLQRQDAPQRRVPPAENMVACAQCGVNVPQTEAIFSRGEFFCTDDHRRLRQQ